MKRTYKQRHQLIAYILIVSLFLQSCGGFHNAIIPIQKEPKAITPSIHIESLVDQELTAQGGHAVTLYEEAGKLKADVVVNTHQGFSKNYKCLEVAVEQGAELSYLPNLDKKEQEHRIHLKLAKGEQPAKVIIYKGAGLMGGGKDKKIVLPGEEEEEADENEDDSIPNECFCPITHEIMEDPVIAQDGHTYERAAIQRWFDTGRRTSPKTGAQLLSIELLPNYTMRSLIQDLKAQMPVLARHKLDMNNIEAAIKLREEYIQQELELKGNLLQQEQQKALRLEEQNKQSDIQDIIDKEFVILGMKQVGNKGKEKDQGEPSNKPTTISEKKFLVNFGVNNKPILVNINQSINNIKSDICKIFSIKAADHILEYFNSDYEDFVTVDEDELDNFKNSKKLRIIQRSNNKPKEVNQAVVPVVDYVSKVSSYFANAQSSKINMLLIGETGSGKTTFLSFLQYYKQFANLLNTKSIDIDNLKVLKSRIDITNESAKNRGESMTQICKIYDINIGNTSFRVLDSPGLGDTRGLEQDKLNIKNIVETVNQVSYLNGICIIANGTVPRVTHHFKYVFNELQSIFPKSVLANIFLIMTRCSIKNEVKFPYHELNIDPSRIYCLDNPFALYNDLFTTKNQRDKEALYKRIQFNTENAIQQINYLFEDISKIQTCNTNSFLELYNIKQKIQLDIINGLNNINEYSKTKKSLDIHKAELDKYKKGLEELDKQLKQSKDALDSSKVKAQKEAEEFRSKEQEFENKKTTLKNSETTELNDIQNKLKSIKTESEDIEKEFANIAVELNHINTELKNIEADELNLKNEQNELQNKESLYSDYEYEVEEVERHTEARPYYSTICCSPNCYSICHEHCSLAYTSDHEVFKGCTGVNGATCRTCNHSHTYHEHNYAVWVTKVSKIKKIDGTKKTNYESILARRQNILEEIKENENRKNKNKLRRINNEQRRKVAENRKAQNTLKELKEDKTKNEVQTETQVKLQREIERREKELEKQNEIKIKLQHEIEEHESKHEKNKKEKTRIENELEKAEKDIESVDRQLKELEEKQKQNEKNLSVAINQFNEKSMVKSFRQYIVDLISLIKEYKKAAETTEEKNKFQKIEQDLEKQIGFIK